MSAIRVLIAACGLVVLFSAQPAHAHGFIVRAIPENRAVLERAPVRVQYWFSEALEPEFSSISVRSQTGTVVAAGGVAENDRSLMMARVPSDLPDGAYTVDLRVAFASDGHVIAESRIFFIGAEIGNLAGQAASSAALPLEVFWRALTLASLMLLFGACALYAAVLAPAWGSPAYPGGLPPRVMKRLNRMAGLAFAGCFAGNGLALIQQTMVFFNIDFVRALDPQFWTVVRSGSRFGDVWNARMLFLLIAAGMFAASLYLRRDQPKTVRPFWTANVWALALAIGTFSISSHAAGSLLWPWPGIAVDWLHALGAGFWAGGLMALVIVLPVALAPYSGEQRRLALLAALRRFSRLAVVSVVIVAATGFYSASNWIYAPSDITGTGFGGALALKLLLAGLLLGLGGLHHLALHSERYRRFEMVARRVNSFTATLRLEAVLALAVMGAVGLLSATPVPVPDFARQTVTTPSAVQSAYGYTAAMTIAPGGPGINTYDVVVQRGGLPLNALRVRIRFVNPARDWRGDWQTAEFVGDGLYASAGDDITREGRWWSLVEISEGEAATRLAFEWDIMSQAAAQRTRAPGAANLTALGLVILAVSWAIYPLARAGWAMLDPNPATAAIALGATAATVFFLAAGALLIQNTRREFEESLNPPPAVINTVVPNQASLERGGALFTLRCDDWRDNADFSLLAERLARTRDEALYDAIINGWRSLPGCAGALAPEERWDVVNYLRTFEVAYVE